VWVPGALLLPSIVHNAGLGKFSKNRSCRTFVNPLLILKCRLSEHVGASDVTAYLTYLSARARRCRRGRRPRPGEAAAGKKVLFLLSIKPGETSEQFKERVVATAHETGFLKKKPNEGREG
jgi:hypothetical protein